MMSFNSLPEGKINSFLSALPIELRFALIVDNVPSWGHLGASEAMLNSLKEVTGL